MQWSCSCGVQDPESSDQGKKQDHNPGLKRCWLLFKEQFFLRWSWRQTKGASSFSRITCSKLKNGASWYQEGKQSWQEYSHLTMRSHIILGGDQWKDKKEWAQTEIQKFNLKISYFIYLFIYCVEPGTGCLEKFHSLPPWGIQSPSGHGPEEAALSEPALIRS